MAGRVSVRPAESIAGFGQDRIAVIHDQRREGVLAARFRGGGERDGVAQILQVPRRGGSFHPDLSCRNGMASPLFAEPACKHGERWCLTRPDEEASHDHDSAGDRSDTHPSFPLSAL
jgi:hypothetical protein